MALRTWSGIALYGVLIVLAARLCAYFSGPAALGTVVTMGLTPAAVLLSFFAAPRTRAWVVGVSLALTTVLIVTLYVDVFHAGDAEGAGPAGDVITPVRVSPHR